MILIVIVLLAVISIGLAFLSLRQELKKTKHEEHVSEDLAKGKVLFYAPGHSDHGGTHHTAVSSESEGKS